MLTGPWTKWPRWARCAFSQWSTWTSLDRASSVTVASSLLPVPKHQRRLKHTGIRWAPTIVIFMVNMCVGVRANCAFFLWWDSSSLYGTVAYRLIYENAVRWTTCICTVYMHLWNLWLITHRACNYENIPTQWPSYLLDVNKAFLVAYYRCLQFIIIHTRNCISCVWKAGISVEHSCF